MPIRSSKFQDESPDKVIHGASIGAGDDEPDIVARVEMDATPPAVPVPNADDDDDDDDETETEAEEEEEEEERQELQRLRELWLSLEEREQRLELRLQELEGLRSQEAAARELEARVAAADAEVRILQLSVSALQEENGRLRARAEDLDAARAELARAKEKLRAVKARVQGEQEAAAAALRRKVEELESGGRERVGALVAEVAELRKANAALEADNMELALRLQDAEQQAASGASASNLAAEVIAFLITVFSIIQFYVSNVSFGELFLFDERGRPLKMVPCTLLYDLFFWKVVRCTRFIRMVQNSCSFLRPE